MIKILLFAGFQEAAGTHEVTVNETAISLADLKVALIEMYPKLTFKNAMSALNEEYVMDENTTIQNGDTVAFIPPVSGG